MLAFESSSQFNGLDVIDDLNDNMELDSDADGSHVDPDVDVGLVDDVVEYHNDQVYSPEVHSHHGPVASSSKLPVNITFSIYVSI
jgi:hypothetical protein